MTIGKNIKTLRLRNNMSQQEFAKIAGVSDKAVSTWENDTKTPRMGAIQKIADYFGIKKSDIIEDKPSSSTPVPPPPAYPENAPTPPAGQQEEVSAQGYYHDPEVAAIANEMKENPGIRALLDASRGLKKESIEEVRRFIEFQKAKELGDWD